MLRNISGKHSALGNAEISVRPNHSVSVLFDFIDRSIDGFPAFYLALNDSDRENRISDILVTYFSVCHHQEKEGFIPYHFTKNPSQSHSAKETDIGVRILTNENPVITIAEFEAKRLSETTANKEYVCGNKGGMERFKRGLHASHLTLCGMFGYVQSRTIGEWADKINSWISELSVGNQDSSIDWKSPKEKLVHVTEYSHVDKWSSNNARIGSNHILLFHYFIDLCN